MWKNLLLRVRRALRPFRALGRHRYVPSLDGDRFGWFNLEKRELMPGFPIRDGDTCVDVGCGPGAASEFAALCGAEVHAVDVDPEAIRAVERRMKGWRLARPVHAILSDANPLPLPDGLATRVVAQEVMEHVDDPQQFIGELVRVGRPGALYLLSVPDPASEALLKTIAPEICWRKPNHVRVFGRDEFDRLVRGAGLEIVRRTRDGFFWSMWWALLWAMEGFFPAGAPGTPVLREWNKTWAALLQTPHGARVKQALDDFAPKSQILIARKAA
jgi:SAM-dependent methyltransferase